MSARNAIQRQIFASCRARGIDDDLRRAKIKEQFGKKSLKELTVAQLMIFAQTLNEKKSTNNRYRKKAGNGSVRYILVLWRLLDDHGANNVPGRAGLNAFIRSQFAETWRAVPLDVEQITDNNKLTTIIAALKNRCKQNNIVLEK